VLSAPLQHPCALNCTGTPDICSPASYPDGADTFMDLYEPDGNHPSAKGTYLQALIITSSLTGGAPHCLQPSSFRDPAVGAVLHPALYPYVHVVYHIGMEFLFQDEHRPRGSQRFASDLAAPNFLCLHGAGCRLQGNGYTFGLAADWTALLQALSDAVVFRGTPSSFPAYPWANGARAACSLI
jgi:hypothetical protein